MEPFYVATDDVFFKLCLRCCNTCAEVQDAYRKKGWALKDPDSVAQVVYKLPKISGFYLLGRGEGIVQKLGTYR